MAQWLTAQGARQLVLAGRRGAVNKAQDVLKMLREAGANVLVVKADIAKREDVANLLQTCQTMAPLRGIVHAAGVLDDGVLLQQSPTRFEKVMAPKVQGAWHLHTLSQAWSLDFFICFSSTTSLLGASGQANYAAANAFMDALVHHRHALGQAGLSINWGAWAESGMAAAMSRRSQQRLVELGIENIAPAEGLQAMGQLMGQEAPQVAVLPVEWSKWLKQFADIPPFFEHFRPQTTAQESDSFLQTLATSPLNKRWTRLTTHVRAAVGQVLGIGPSGNSISLQQGFFDYGMDSLTSIELRNYLQTSLESSLPPTLIFNYSTVESLSTYLAENILSVQFASDSEEEPAPEKEPLASQFEETTLRELEEISEAEADAWLLEELESLEF